MQSGVPPVEAKNEFENLVNKTRELYLFVQKLKEYNVYTEDIIAALVLKKRLESESKKPNLSVSDYEQFLINCQLTLLFDLVQDYLSRIVIGLAGVNNAADPDLLNSTLVKLNLSNTDKEVLAFLNGLLNKLPEKSQRGEEASNLMLLCGAIDKALSLDSYSSQQLAEEKHDLMNKDPSSGSAVLEEQLAQRDNTLNLYRAQRQQHPPPKDGFFQKIINLLLIVHNKYADKIPKEKDEVIPDDIKHIESGNVAYADLFAKTDEDLEEPSEEVLDLINIAAQYVSTLDKHDPTGDLAKKIVRGIAENTVSLSLIQLSEIISILQQFKKNRDTIAIIVVLKTELEAKTLEQNNKKLITHRSLQFVSNVISANNLAEAVHGVAQLGECTSAEWESARNSEYSFCLDRFDTGMLSKIQNFVEQNKETDTGKKLLLGLQRFSELTRFVLKKDVNTNESAVTNFVKDILIPYSIFRQEVNEQIEEIRKIAKKLKENKQVAILKIAAELQVIANDFFKNPFINPDRIGMFKYEFLGKLGQLDSKLTVASFPRGSKNDKEDREYYENVIINTKELLHKKIPQENLKSKSTLGWSVAGALLLGAAGVLLSFVPGLQLLGGGLIGAAILGGTGIVAGGATGAGLATYQNKKFSFYRRPAIWGLVGGICLGLAGLALSFIPGLQPIGIGLTYLGLKSAAAAAVTLGVTGAGLGLLAGVKIAKMQNKQDEKTMQLPSLIKIKEPVKAFTPTDVFLSKTFSDSESPSRTNTSPSLSDTRMSESGQSPQQQSKSDSDTSLSSTSSPESERKRSNSLGSS